MGTKETAIVRPPISASCLAQKPKIASMDSTFARKNMVMKAIIAAATETINAHTYAKSLIANSCANTTQIISMTRDTFAAINICVKRIARIAIVREHANSI